MDVSGEVVIGKRDCGNWRRVLGKSVYWEERMNIEKREESEWW